MQLPSASVPAGALEQFWCHFGCGSPMTLRMRVCTNWRVEIHYDEASSCLFMLFPLHSLPSAPSLLIRAHWAEMSKIAQGARGNGCETAQPSSDTPTIFFMRRRSLVVVRSCAEHSCRAEQPWSISHTRDPRMPTPTPRFASHFHDNLADRGGAET